MADNGKRKLSGDSVSPETNQAKKHQGDLSPVNSGDVLASLPGAQCPHCSEPCLPESKAIQCDLCGIWVHAECESISNELYDKFSDVCASINNLSYFCEANHCNSRVKQLIFSHFASLEQQADISSLRALQAEQANLHRLISELSEKLDDLNSRNNILRSEVETTSELISAENQPVVRPESPAATFLTVAQELDDRERRKNNVIIYNLPETSPQQDEKWFTDLCKAVFDIGIKVTKILRLGKPTEDKTRPLLIVLENLSHKEFIVSHSHYLRRHSQYNNIYVSADMTKFQRDKHRKLVQELKQRRGRGEKNLTILNGEIVLRKYRNPTSASTTPPTGEASNSS